MLWLAAVAGAFVMDRSFRRARVTADAMGIVAVTVVAGIVGAKLWHVIDTPIEFRYLGWSVCGKGMDTPGSAGSSSASARCSSRAGGRRSACCAPWI
jgi:hypothetical protein